MEVYKNLNINVQEIIDYKISENIKENNKDIIKDLHLYFFEKQYEYKYYRCADRIIEYDMFGDCEEIIVFYDN